MTEDDIARIDKQFDLLEETLRCGFDRMESKIDRMLADLAEIRATFDRIDAMKRDMEPKP